MCVVSGHRGGNATKAVILFGSTEIIHDMCFNTNFEML
jgi:hypothetical protein